MLHKDGVTSEEGRATRRQSKRVHPAVLIFFSDVGVCPPDLCHRSRQSEVFARAEEQVRSFSPNATRLAALFAQESFCVQMKPCRPRTSNTFPDPSRASAPDHSLPRAGPTLQSLKSRKHRVTFQFDIPLPPPPPPPPEILSSSGVQEP